MPFDLLIPNFLLILTSYKYLLLFMAIVIEGPILMVASGFLILLGFFEPIPTFLIILAGDLLGDIIWYYIGYFFAEPFLNKYGKFFKLNPEMFEKAKELFNKYHVKILLISKITIGFGMSLATLMAAGAIHIPLRKYLTLNFLGEVILVSILLSVGYFFGQLYSSIADTMKIYFVAGIIIIIGTSWYYFTKYIKYTIKVSP
ncbi:MAG: DedA family protein [Candidatus Paceibacterota bacterium]